MCTVFTLLVENKNNWTYRGHYGLYGLYENKIVTLVMYIFSLLFCVNYRTSIGRISMTVIPTELFDKQIVNSNITLIYASSLCGDKCVRFLLSVYDFFCWILSRTLRTLRTVRTSVLVFGYV